MDPTQNAAFVIFSAISPLLIAFIKQQGFSPQVNAVIAFACYVVFGILGAVVSGETLSFENIVPLITLATVVGSAVYQLIWSNIGTGSTGTAPSLDERLTDATSIVKS